jgi:hypothetical protein
MPTDFLRADPSLTPAAQFYASKLVSTSKGLRSVIDQLEEIFAVMSHNNNGSTFTQIETLFGLASGNGQAVFDLVNGTLLALKGTAQNSNAISLIDRVG